MEKKLIFFIDDDKMMLNLMEYTFQSRDGYEVKSFFSGEDCIRNLYHNPDLIVLDYILGEDDETSMSGLETLKQIRKSRADLPVIILSREKDEGLINEFIKVGAKKYVVKDDYFIDTLITAIQKHFTHKHV